MDIARLAAIAPKRRLARRLPHRARCVACAALAVVWLGCAEPPSRVRIGPPIGPRPSALASSEGWLLVRTGLRAVPTTSEIDELRREPYEVFDLRGRPVASVAGGPHATLARIPLPAGRYFVRGVGLSGALVDAQVVVAEGTTTEVFLDGSFSPPVTQRGAVVRAPDGSSVGWRAESERPAE